MGKKQSILKKISKNLQYFNSRYKDKFMCPTCLSVIPITSNSKISEAHIFPKASGGKLKTYLCKKCNSNFGALQDKWLGEFINLQRDNKHPLHSEKQKGYFEINGIKVSGVHKISENGGIELYIWRDKNHPDILKKIGTPSKLSLSSPVQENEELVNIGFLTSAYLLWFKEVGYSWILQKHLDPVRKQILNPKKQILPKNFVMTTNIKFPYPWIGAGIIDNKTHLFMGIDNKLVFLPPVGSKNYYESLSVSGNENIKNHRILNFVKKHEFGPPIGIIYKDKIIIHPDLMREGKIKTAFLGFIDNENPPRLLFPISDKEAEKLSKIKTTQKHILNMKEYKMHVKK